MPYEYKRQQKCKQKSGDSGNYVSKKAGAAHQKCWKSKDAFDNAASARHAKGISEDDGVIPVIEIEEALRRLVRNVLVESIDDSTWEIGQSPIHGLGVFTTDQVPAGTNLGAAQIQKPV